MKIILTREDVNSYLEKHPFTSVVLTLESVVLDQLRFKVTGNVPAVPIEISMHFTLTEITATKFNGVSGSFQLNLPILLKPFRGIIENYLQNKLPFLNFQTTRFSYPIPLEIWNHLSSVSIKLDTDEINMSVAI